MTDERANDPDRVNSELELEYWRVAAEIATFDEWVAYFPPGTRPDFATLSACGADPLVAAPLGRAHLALAAGAGDEDAEFVSAVLAFRREPDPDDTSPGRAFRAEIAVDDHS
ncbi:hypothetical protein [Tessaracoccus defluvii]|uniref:Uncharacterized protein n=1 Tax=Tessaracoccus defluvii TaxID=1285901 RepID=A0A7H0H2T3_9ACTN|nr:hypothetical protein [Tessaracoccus defluvii]QNP54849.1 hypothetical protein H9L22_11110 [Tessaracoccus defluvii]